MGDLIQFPKGVFKMSTKLARKWSKRSLKDIVVGNVDYFYKKQWKQQEPKGKTVYNVTQGGNTTIETLELVASRAKIPSWYLLVNLPEDLLISSEVDDLVYLYTLLDKKGREYVMQAAILASK